MTKPRSALPGADFARFVALDGLLHGWDLSQATGHSYAPREGLVFAVDSFARQAVTPEMRDGGAFAAASAPLPGSDALAQLVAFSGRRAPSTGATNQSPLA